MQVEVDKAASDWIANNPDRRWQQLLDYWRLLVDTAGRLPRRREIDPVALPPDLLRNIFLIDVVRASDGTLPRFRFRLLGSAIVDRESTKVGQFVDQLGAVADTAEMLAHYRDCLAGKVRVRNTTLLWDDARKEHVRYRVLLLPLGDDDAIDTVLGLAIYEA
jgi:hypothetical protein